MEDKDLLDEDTTIVPTQNYITVNTFTSNLLQRLGIAHGQTGQLTNTKVVI